MKEIEKDIDIILEFLIDSISLRDLPNTDAIFVFGHYEPKVAYQAVKLWKENKAPYIIISGKGRDKIPEGFNTEAGFYASILKSEDIPEEALILEKKATNSLENVLWGMKACHEKDFYPKSLILCAIPPLLKRSCATFKKHFPNISVYGSAFTLPKEWLTVRIVKRLLGEIERIKDYGKKGDIEKIGIPNKVLSSVNNVQGYLKQQSRYSGDK